MVLFALSCIGLLLFLWLSFGGTLPFNPQGYRIKVSFQYADELAGQSDVRIAGVSVGSVVSTQLAPGGNRTLATLQIDRQYAPLPADTRAILRTKTILGETYVELSPGTRNGKYIPDGGTIPNSQVLPAVQLDQIFSTFNGPTRRAFTQWQEELAAAIKGNDQNLNDVLGNLPSFAGNAADILNVLDIEHDAVVNLVRNGGTVFGAISSDPSALQSLITTGEETFAATAAQNQALEATFHVFPTFLNESKLTLADLQTFADNTNPLIKELIPVADNLGPTLHDVKVLSPSLEHFFVSLGPLITVSKTGLPAVAKVLNGTGPLLNQLGPFLEQLNPILGWLSLHQQLISDFLSDGAAGLAAKTTAFGGGSDGHYLRQFSPVGPEVLALDSNRDSGNRGNTYPPPLWLFSKANFVNGNFPAWDCKNTGAPGNGTEPADTAPETGHEACWVAPTVPGGMDSTFPHITAASYSSKPPKS
jgi:phospholipid/cholesterol/gamma-HCH transport system substrate-binding protein